MLNKYYVLSDKSPVYACALLLNPSKRKRYIERNQQELWQQPAIDSARKLWLDNYNNDPPLPSSSISSPEVLFRSRRPPNELDLLLSDIAVIDPVADHINNFNTFITLPPIPINRYKLPLEQQCYLDRVKAYPRLYYIAIDILLISLESLDLEITFSLA